MEELSAFTGVSPYMLMKAIPDVPKFSLFSGQHQPLLLLDFRILNDP
jgi:hypothetical protein